MSPTTTLGQNQQELRFLIFEPVLIDRIQIPATEAEGQEEIIVSELTSLPVSENPPSVSELLFSQARDISEDQPVNLNNSIVEYEEKVKNLELQGGAYEPELSQELLSLGTLYQSQGEHLKAVEYLEQALHINRVNLGLFNLEQENIIEEKIESYVALGDLRAADAQQEYLIYLKRKMYGSTSVDLLPALNEYADWNIFAFDSRLSMDPTLDYAADATIYNQNTVNNSIGEEDFKTVRLLNAQNIYRTIIQIILNNYGLADPRLLEMEKKLALTNYFFATNLDINSKAYNGNNSALAMNSSQGYYDNTRVSTNSMGYRHGREALERRLEYMLDMEEVSPIEIATAHLELGDWLLIFKKRVAALEVYEDAYAQLQAAGRSQEEIEAIFNPEFPVQIPTFIDYRYTRAAMNIPEDAALEYQGWIDVSFRVNRFGQTQGVDILDRSLSVTDPIETRLLRNIRNTSFRPRFRNDELVEEDYILARYYYSY